MDTSKVASSEDSPGVEDGSPDTMRAVVMKEAGDAEVLRVAELPAPHAGAGEVRISVNAATVNAGDLLLRQGGGPSVVEILGMDAAGIIDEIGPGTTTDLKLGDRVMAFVQPLRPAGGAYAQKVVLPANWVVQAPQGTSDVEASTLPMNGLTAMLAIDTLALSPGETVAVTGAAGGLGGYVVQLAHIAGLRVIADAAPADVDLVHPLQQAHRRHPRRGLRLLRRPDRHVRRRLHPRPLPPAARPRDGPAARRRLHPAPAAPHDPH
ncbi:quinone oxidoreductase family protein [Streptomyces olivaceoviridis]|uniref:quinone oxidoreductase family protein n=1 Tax=Streptomyces olivaceoviridis TaxID=1921 RepID=UPI003318C1A6